MAETKSLAEMVADNIADQLDSQKAADDQMRVHQEKTRAEIEDAQSMLLRRLTDRSAQQKQAAMPAPVQEIVAVLVQQPRFIEPTRQFLTELVRRVNAAVDGAIVGMGTVDSNTTSTVKP